MKTSNIIIIALAVLILNAGITLVLINQKETKAPASTTTIVDPSHNQRHNEITSAVQAVEPAVVSVNVTKTQLVRPGFGFSIFDFFGDIPIQRQVVSIGSGVIYDANGYIITNAHVIEGASEIKVVLPDKREFIAKVVGVDNTYDVAKLKIDGNNFPYAKLGTAKELLIGEWAIALGNPYGFMMSDPKPSVSVGVISALNRSFQPQDGHRYINMIQTDAAINPGNSGGPLVNVKGEVIGINTFIVSGTGDNVGLGFAIPIDRVKSIIKIL